MWEAIAVGWRLQLYINRRKTNEEKLKIGGMY